VTNQYTLVSTVIYIPEISQPQMSGTQQQLYTRLLRFLLKIRRQVGQFLGSSLFLSLE